MGTLMIHNLLPSRALVSRESARALQPPLMACAGLEEKLTIDFEGIDALTPSFVDELLKVLRFTLKDTGSGKLQVSFANMPTRLSSKFAAIARAHDLKITEVSPGSWLIEGSLLLASTSPSS